MARGVWFSEVCSGRKTQETAVSKWVKCKMSEDSGARAVRERQPERIQRVIAETTERVDVSRTRRSGAPV